MTLQPFELRFNGFELHDPVREAWVLTPQRSASDSEHTANVRCFQQRLQGVGADKAGRPSE
jgi:hypothetical protein